MGRIFLIRHGKVDIDQAKWIAGNTLSNFVSRYDEATIVGSVSLPRPVVEIVRTADVVVCSDRRRTLDSASLIAPDTDVLSGREYREAGLPTAFRTRLRLRADLWVAVARGAWFLGWAPNCETVDDVKARAARAAANLVQLASERGSVVLVGHAVFNGYIASCLRRAGLVGPRLGPTQPWGLAEYVDRPYRALRRTALARRR